MQSLAAEIRAASFTNIDDLLAFVNWLDEELSFLVCALPFSQLHKQSCCLSFKWKTINELCLEMIYVFDDSFLVSSSPAVTILFESCLC